MSLYVHFYDRADVLIAGLIGAVINLIISKEPSTPKQKVGFLFSGTFFSFYLAKLAMKFFHLESVEFVAPMGFLLGLLGVSVAQAVLRSLKTMDVADLLKGLLSELFNKLTALISSRKGGNE